MKPKKLPERGLEPEIRRAFNQLLDHVEGLKILPNSDVEIDRTTRGTFIRPKGSGNNTDNNQAPRWG